MNNPYSINLPSFLQPFACDSLIRLGKDNDGGYLVNEQDCFKSKLLISCGVGEDYSFEEAFLNKANCKCITFDRSISSDKILNNQIQHIQQNIGISIDSFSLSSIIVPDIFLKIDIEGDEYFILDDLILSAHNLTGLVIEFHNINNNMPAIVDFLTKFSLRLVHLHINNYFYYKTDTTHLPDIIELTFTSSNNIGIDRSICLPHPLDQSNNPLGEDFFINFNNAYS
jgi:hypothetical protein